MPRQVCLTQSCCDDKYRSRRAPNNKKYIPNRDGFQMKKIGISLLLAIALSTCTDELSRARPYVLTTATTGGIRITRYLLNCNQFSWLSGKLKTFTGQPGPVCNFTGTIWCLVLDWRRTRQQSTNSFAKR